MINNQQSRSQKVAKALIEISAVGFKPSSPFRFKSGVLSPIYVDNRILPSFPDQWQVIIDSFVLLIKEAGISFDLIAGVESAGIPHSATLGFVLKKPSCFVRKTAKDHGTKKLVEGADVGEKQVLLVEDLVTMGTSSLQAVANIRAQKGIVTHCLSIVSFGMPEAKKAFLAQKVDLLSLTSFNVILEEALNLKVFNHRQKAILDDWFADPWGWGKRHGFE